MPDAEKRRRADFVIPTGRGKGATYAAIRRLVSTLLRRRATRPSRRQSVRRMTRASIHGSGLRKGNDVGSAMTYFYLALAIVFEVIATSSLKSSKG